MAENENDGNDRENQRITVEATDVEGIAAALGIELVEEPERPEPPDYPEGLRAVLDTLADIYGGVHEATETDSRGRSRKMIRQYASREDLSSDEVGHILRVLEAHELVDQDGNRWRIPEAED
jgi:hypothetical protein